MHKKIENPKPSTKQVTENISSEALHQHEWHFVREDVHNYTGKLYTKFVCPCGAYKRIEQFEVKD